MMRFRTWVDCSISSSLGATLIGLEEEGLFLLFSLCLERQWLVENFVVNRLALLLQRGDSTNPRGSPVESNILVREVVIVVQA